jgi:HEAT repeat protein
MAPMRMCKALLGVMCLMTAWWASPATAQQRAESAATIIAAAEGRAVNMVVEAARSDNAMLRANAMEAIQWRPDRALPLIQLGVEDRNPAVRFVALVTAGKLRAGVVRHSAEHMLKDPNDSVKAAAIYALHRIGAPVDPTPMAAMLASRDATVRGNAAMLLGRMGERSAIDMMMELSATPLPRASSVRLAIVRLQVAEAVVNLGDESSLDAIRAAAYSEFDEVRILSVMMLGRLRDRKMEPALRQLLTVTPFELALAAAGAVAQMGSDQGLSVALGGAASQIPTQRAQAAFVLRYFGNVEAARALVRLLDDPDPAVRLSAAAAILMPPDAEGF